MGANQAWNLSSGARASVEPLEQAVGCFLQSQEEKGSSGLRLPSVNEHFGQRGPDADVREGAVESSRKCCSFGRSVA
jgi:hypothetical protein